MREPSDVLHGHVKSYVNWRQLLEALQDCVSKGHPVQFCEADADQLERMAKSIRSKLEIK